MVNCREVKKKKIAADFCWERVEISLQWRPSPLHGCCVSVLQTRRHVWIIFFCCWFFCSTYSGIFCYLCFFFFFTYFSAGPWKLLKAFMRAADSSLVAKNASSLWHEFAKSKKKLHAAPFTSRSTKPRLASYWEAVWLIRRRLVQSGRSAETQGGVGVGWGWRGACFTSKHGDERHGKPAHAASQDREESPRRCHTLKGVFNRDLFAPLASLYRT